MSGPTFHMYFEQNSAEWFNIRAGKVTASEMHRIITPTGKLPKIETTWAYMSKLIAEWYLGKPLGDNEYQSEFMSLGHENEQATVESFEFQTDMETTTVGFVECANGLVGCSPDRLILGPDGVPVGTLEVKTPAPQTQIGYLLDPSALEQKYFVQTQTQLWACRFEFGYIHTDSKPLPPIKPLRINRNEEFISKIEKQTNTFLEVMLKHREEIAARYGPPKAKPKLKGEYDPIFAGMGVSEADIEGLRQ